MPLKDGSPDGKRESFGDDHLLNRFTADSYLRRQADHSWPEDLRRADLSLLDRRETADAILDDDPNLEREDLRACLAHARAVIADDKIEAVPVVTP